LIQPDTTASGLHQQQVSGTFNLTLAYRKLVLSEHNTAREILAKYHPIAYAKEGMYTYSIT